MASALNTKLIMVGVAVLCLSMFSQGDPMLCSRAYKFGGPSAILSAPECSFLKSFDLRTFCRKRSAIGLTEYHNHSFCGLRMGIGLDGEKGEEGIEIMGSGVFSGNITNGMEAASKSKSHMRALMDYFAKHARLLLRTKEFTGKLKSTDSFHLRLLKEALINTAKDANAILSPEVFASNSTVTITLPINEHVLVANIGHPKTAVWSMKLRPWSKSKSSHFIQLLDKIRDDVPPTDEVEAIKFVESSGRTRVVVKELPEHHSQDRKNWVHSAFDLVLDSVDVPRQHDHVDCIFERMGRREKSKTSSADPVAKVLEVMASEEAVALKHLGVYQVVEKMNLSEEASGLLWEKGANSDNQKKPMKEFLASAVITMDFEGTISAVVMPLLGHS